jgi:hypothetical protein
MSNLATFATTDEKAKFRKVKVMPSKVKASLYHDANAEHCPAITMQLGSDIATYGIYEALLYVENYEADGYYLEGAALRAFKLLVGRN